MPAPIRRTDVYLSVELGARVWRLPGHEGIVVIKEMQALIGVEWLDARAGPLTKGAAAVHEYIELLL
jgi:hypothetical protein